MVNFARDRRLRALLDQPRLFNAVRWVLAGSQDVTRRLLVAHMPMGPRDSLLDVCCGTGDFAMLAPGQYAGLDLNARFLGFARQRYAGDARKTFVLADATRPCFGDGVFTKAYFLGSLHHFPDVQARLVLGEIARVTSGQVAVTDLLAEVSNPVRRFFALRDRGDYVRTLGEQKALLTEAFTLETCQVFGSRLAVQSLMICKPRRAGAASGHAHDADEAA